MGTLADSAGMSAPSPNAESGLMTIEVKAAGEVVDSSYEIVLIDTWNAVNSVPRARFVLVDGVAADGTFAISSSGPFLPGTAIEISAGYEGTLTPIFSGNVVKHGIEIPPNAASTLIVDVADAAFAMTVARKTAVSQNLTDSDVISRLIAGYGALSSDIAATTVEHEAIVQFDATDWDTMLTRAEMNGLLVTVDGGRVTVRAPDTSKAASLRVAYGESILNLRAEIDAVPASAITTRGQVRFQGSALVKTGDMIQLGGLGDRFNGDVLVSAVHHEINDGAWITTVDFGLPAGWPAQQRPSTFAPASGDLPLARGLHTGILQQPSKTEMTVDETDKVVTIKTPGGHRVTLDDKAGSISLQDSNQNSVVLGRDGILIDSTSSIDIKAKGNITIAPQGNLSMKVTQNATCEALHVELKAQTTLSAQGSAAAELKSSGVVTVQGSLVKIN